MKKMSIFIACMSIICTVGFSSCDSSKKDSEKAEAKLNDAANDLTEARINEQSDSLKLVSAEEWELFKQSTESKIKDHEIRIEFLKKTLKASRTKQTKEISEKIDALEEKNRVLKTRLDNYDKTQSDWAKFKKDFGYDMDELGNALKNFTIPNK
jgi:hypothetical protein